MWITLFRGGRDRSCIGSGRITGSDRTATGLAGDYRDFKKLGVPRLFFGVSAGAWIQ